jgi:1-acyl-sn-glycerol-3-phosphate acyltransferase
MDSPIPFTNRVVNATIKRILRLICRVHDAQLAQVPAEGPLIVVANHVTFLEAPLLYTHLQPRRMTGFAKAEAWDNPFLRTLFNLWDVIPLRRGEADVAAFRQALAALDEGQILAVAPEGTRSGHGRLQPAHSGVVTLALRSGAPLQAMAYHGGEKLRRNLTRLRRTDFYIAVGRTFHLETHGLRVTRQVRQRMVDEIMYQIAALLPPAYRGHYANLAAATEHYLKFVSPREPVVR